MAKKEKVARTEPITITKDTPYADILFIDILKYCKDNKQVAWLKEVANTKVAQNVYPKGEDGKPNKKAAPIETKMIDMPYIVLKQKFMEKFFTKPIEPKTTWIDTVNALEEEE